MSIPKSIQAISKKLLLNFVSLTIVAYLCGALGGIGGMPLTHNIFYYLIMMFYFAKLAVGLLNDCKIASYYSTVCNI